MEIQFLGGAGEVGRSGFLLRGSKNILLDYGVKINGMTEYPLVPGRVDAYVLSHAHLDHCGNAPFLYHHGSPVSFGTEPTLSLAELLIEDSIEVQKKRHLKPKFSKREVKSFMNAFVPYNYGSEIDLGDYTITLHDAGHISGSAITLMENKKSHRRIAYTGDFKLSNQTLHEGAEVVETDTLIIESTYATREHPDRDNLIKLFVDNIKEVVENNGVALIPVFAVGRSQEVLAILEKNRLTDYVYLDGMAKKATEITLRYPQFMANKELLANAIKRVTQIHKGRGRDEALDGGSIIVTTAGMLNGGPVLDYITKLNSASMIFLTGYQAENTNGRRLLEDRPLIIDREKRHIRTPFSFYDLSAHAGQQDLYDYVKRSNAETVICVHGDGESTTSFKDWLEAEGFEAHAPSLGEHIKVNI